MTDNKMMIQIPTIDEIEKFEQHDLLTPIFKKKKIIDEQEPETSTGSCTVKNAHIAATIAAPPTAQGAVSMTSGDNSDTTNVTIVKQSLPATSTKAPKGSNSILVSSKQQGNPILKHVRHVPWEFANIVPDYELGQNVCALFLSVRYHQHNPEYIHGRLRDLGKAYDVRVILMLVDSKEPHQAMKELARICILADCTLILAFSAEEAGRYLETYKVYENKPADVLMEKADDNYMAQFTDCLTTVKSVNKTDCSTLLSTFGSFEKISLAMADDLSLCPGVGPQKASRLHGVLHEPFLKSHKTTDKTEFAESLS